jgi:hypothetical protein
MTDKRIDEILGTEEALAPSSGFVVSVMDRVRAEAAAPPPIPFPWKRAVPGFVLAAGVLGWGAVEFVRFTGPAIATIKLPQVTVVLAASSRPLQQAGWVVAALAVSLASWMISRRVAG